MPAGNLCSYAGMSNVLDEEKQQQRRTLGGLGWTLRRIEQATGVRRETVGAYLRSAGLPVRARGGRPSVWPPANPATTPEVSTDPVPSNPATSGGVSTDPAAPVPGGPGARLRAGCQCL